jgi:predicted nucleic acid-binding protein
MILADTSVWVDHLRKRDEALFAWLNEGRIITHPFVVGELAMGNLPKRSVVLESLKRLRQATIASDAEVLDFIERADIAGRGIGYVDAHLLAAVRITQGASLWTRDKRLAAVAQRLALATSVG